MGRTASSPGRVLAQRYELEEELGRGGMGTVYLARDLKYDRAVAIKFLGADLPAGGGDASRFLEEIRTSARLNHPHILALHDSGEDDGSLYFVMPRVEGASLRDRLEREGRLAVPEAVRVARQVADALSYAHAQGVVHRDIKPENVLLDKQGHVWVADFGLARALSSVTNTRLTRPGLVVGSPAYMSPEQVAGDEEVDGRSDLYALGCVLFEMLVGRAPFTGTRAQEVMGQHIAGAVPSMRGLRADVPPELDRIVQCLLAKNPDDRYATADDVARELERVAHQSGNRSTAAPAADSLSERLVAAFRSPIGWTLTGALLGLGAIAFWALRPDPSSAPAAPDSVAASLAVLPLSSGAEADGASHHLFLRDAFARWQDVFVADAIRVADEVAGVGGANELTPEAATTVARELGVDHYVQGSQVVVGDSIQITVGLYDAHADGRLVRSASINVPLRGRASSLTYALLADSLLFGQAVPGLVPGADVGTAYAGARSDYASARAALESWDVATADSLLGAAIETDPRFTRAHLWLAQVRNWRGLPPEYWANQADIAAADTGALVGRERHLAQGLSALGRDEGPAACAAFDRMVELDRRDFAGWYGLGECHSTDKIVLPDPRSPSGYRFRGSYHTAVEAYREAFRILPSSHLMARSGGLERIHDQLFTAGLRVRVGRREGGDQPEFVAHPGIIDDTLAFVPWTWDQWTGGDERSWREAADRQRRVFSDIARGWVAANPGSPEAAYVQAIALDLLRDPASVTWIRRARELEHAAPPSIQLGAAQVWLELRYGAPDTTRIAAARVLADSLLASAPDDSTSARVLAPIAVLLGRPSRAARLAATLSDPQVPAAAERQAAALLAFASAGGPVDSIAYYERETQNALRVAVGATEQSRMRGLMLEQPAVLAFPAHVMELLRVDSLRTSAGAAQQAFLRGDSATLATLVDSLGDAQHDAGEWSPEAQYVSARLLAIAGDTAAATRLLDDMLGSLRWLTPDTFQRLGDAGVIGRAMALRARIAQRQSDEPNARRWGDAIATLWATAEPQLRSAAQRLRDGP